MKLLASLHHVLVLLTPSVMGEEKSFILSPSSRLCGLLCRGRLALVSLLLCAHVMTCWWMSHMSSGHSLGLLNSAPEDPTVGQNYQRVGDLQPALASTSLASTQQQARGRCNLSLSSKRKSFLLLMCIFHALSLMQKKFGYVFSESFLPKPLWY